MTQIQTSFGELKILYKENKKPLIEHLVFNKSGRAHQHPEYESFFVISGKGKIYSGENIYDVEPGDLVSIPPKTKHWMEPEGEEPLIGLLWYHQTKLQRPQPNKKQETEDSL